MFKKKIKERYFENPEDFLKISLKGIRHHFSDPKREKDYDRIFINFLLIVTEGRYNPRFDYSPTFDAVNTVLNNLTKIHGLCFAAPPVVARIFITVCARFNEDFFEDVNFGDDVLKSSFYCKQIDEIISEFNLW